MAYVAVALVAGLPACEDGSRTDVVSVDDSGSLDISAIAASLDIRVNFDRQCLSSSCDQVQIATCSASLTGDRIVVSSSLVYTSDRGGACTDDCGSPSAECSVSVPTPGTYALTHGSCQATLTLPLSTSVQECGRR